MAKSEKRLMKFRTSEEMQLYLFCLGFLSSYGREAIETIDNEDIDMNLFIGFKRFSFD